MDTKGFFTENKMRMEIKLYENNFNFFFLILK